MRYFTMRQDRGLPYALQLRGFDITSPGHMFTKAEEDKLKDTSILYMAGSGDEAMPDFLQSPVYLVSERIKEILDLYEDGLIFKETIMIHKEAEVQFTYYHILMDELEALSSSTQYYPNGIEKEIILDREKVKGRNLFLLADSKTKTPIVSLNVVESLLKRHTIGILFEELEVR